MTDYEILSLAHRICWKYKENDKGPNYTFDKETMLEFVRIIGETNWKDLSYTQKMRLS